MVTAVVLFVIIFVIYQFVKPKTPKVPKATAFDLFLMEQYKQSAERAKTIPDVSTTIEKEKEPSRSDDFISDLYLGMIKSGKYDSEGLRKEAIEAMGITELELDELLEQYKVDKKKK